MHFGFLELVQLLALFRVAEASNLRSDRVRDPSDSRKPQTDIRQARTVGLDRRLGDWPLMPDRLPFVTAATVSKGYTS